MKGVRPMNDIEFLQNVLTNLKAGKPAGFGLMCGSERSTSVTIGDMGFFKGYTLAPRTHIVNGFDVPIAMDVEPKTGVEYSNPVVAHEQLFESIRWDGDEEDYRLLARNLCFSTKEAAQQNALAMMGYDPATTKVGDV